jgi:hypothetical protein
VAEPSTGQPAALGGDRAALDAVRRGDLDLHIAVTCLVADLVDLRRAHSRPELGDLRRNVVAYAQVVGRVVTCLVAAEEDRRELVEGELAVGNRVALRAVGTDQLLVGVVLEARVTGREVAAARGHRAGHCSSDPEASAEGGPHVAHLLQVAPDEALLERLVVARERPAPARSLAPLQRGEGRLGRELA